MGAETPAAAVQQKKPLSNALKIFFGVGDFGFNLMSSVETYYFVFFLTNFAMFDAPTAALVSGVGSTGSLSFLVAGFAMGRSHSVLP